MSRPIAYVPFVAGRVHYHAVQADVASGLVDSRTVLAEGLFSPWRLIQDNQPTVAVNGTFFAPQDGTPVADVLVDGVLEARGNRGTALAVALDGTIHIEDRGFRRRFDWEGFRYGMRGGVRILRNGAVCPNPKAQAFKDPRIWGRAARTAVGITKHGKLLIVATRHGVTLSQLAKAMRSRGVVDAVSLDGGGSTCMYYRGKMVVSTGRRLSNLFTLHERAIVAAR
jgi:exopolysaccharide biosynthesis protein